MNYTLIAVFYLRLCLIILSVIAKNRRHMGKDIFFVHQRRTLMLVLLRSLRQVVLYHSMARIGCTRKRMLD